MNFNNYVIYLFICLLLSFLIGAERQYRRRFIGLRTTILVAVGSYLYVSFSLLLSGENSDMTRIAAQVVSGMGFLGAGVIIKDGQKVRGLTTAATLWCDAAIGVLCAGGFIREAIAGTFAILFANIILRYINKVINRSTEARHINERYLINVVASKDNLKTIKMEMEDFISKDSMTVNSINVSNNEINYDICLIKSKVKKLEKFVTGLNDIYEIESTCIQKLMEDEIEDFEEQ